MPCSGWGGMSVAPFPAVVWLHIWHRWHESDVEVLLKVTDAKISYVNRQLCCWVVKNSRFSTDWLQRPSYETVLCWISASCQVHSLATWLAVALPGLRQESFPCPIKSETFLTPEIEPEASCMQSNSVQGCVWTACGFKPVWDLGVWCLQVLVIALLSMELLLA